MAIYSETEICDCMARQDSLGQSVCKRCNGDIYACECPMRHFSTCPKFPVEGYEPLEPIEIEEFDPEQEDFLDWLMRD